MPGKELRIWQARLPIEDIAGLMLYSAHQRIPADGMNGPFSATYGGEELLRKARRSHGN